VLSFKRVMGDKKKMFDSYCLTSREMNLQKRSGFFSGLVDDCRAHILSYVHPRGPIKRVCRLMWSMVSQLDVEAARAILRSPKVCAFLQANGGAVPETVDKKQAGRFLGSVAVLLSKTICLPVPESIREVVEKGEAYYWSRPIDNNAYKLFSKIVPYPSAGSIVYDTPLLERMIDESGMEVILPSAVPYALITYCQPGGLCYTKVEPRSVDEGRTEGDGYTLVARR